MANINPDLARRPRLKRNNSLSRKESLKHNTSLRRKGSQHSAKRSGPTDRFADLEAPNSLPDNQSDQSSAYSLSLENVPPRSSSRNRLDVREQSAHNLRQAESSKSTMTTPGAPPPAPRGMGYTIPNRGRSNSPIKKLDRKYSNLALDSARPGAPRTFIRTFDPNMDVVDFPTHRHPRLVAELQVGATLSARGGSIEGHVRIVVNDLERSRHKRQVAISRISIDLLGVEEMSGGKRSVFLNLAAELIDSNNPPPLNMVEDVKQISTIDPFWHLVPSISSLPFNLSLPLDVGPPPFHSKHARIRYVLAVTILIRESGKQYLVRSSQDISVISVYDPEKALMSLPTPLTVSDEYIRQREPMEKVKVAAGLHRQVWVGGTSIFVDVHISNGTKKPLRRLELQLERDILCYKHTPATLEKVIDHARVFDFNERTILSKRTLKASNSSGWNGVPPHSAELRTFDLELPRGNATVKCGKFFEVRYFLNTIVGTSSKPKLITVQLPIVLIHMNSLDVVPNSVAQVATAIEQRRYHEKNPSGRTPYQTRATSVNSVQGRAFAAPRKQSHDRPREDLLEIERILAASPRRYRLEHSHQASSQQRNLSRPETAFPVAQNKPSQPQMVPLRPLFPSSEPLPPPGFRLPGHDVFFSDDYTYEDSLARPPPIGTIGLRPTTIEEARERLCKMRSVEQSRSTSSLIHLGAANPAPLKVRTEGHKSNPRYEPILVGRPAPLPTNPVDITHGNHPPTLGPQFRRMRSAERYRAAGGWFGERNNEKERYKETEDRTKALGNWI